LNLSAAARQQLSSSSATAARQHLSSSSTATARGNERRGGRDTRRVRACRSPRADEEDGNSRFLTNMFSKLLERVFIIDLPKFMR